MRRETLIDVNKWRDITQDLCQSCFTYIFVRQTHQNGELEYVINRLSHGILLITKTIISPRGKLSG